MTASLETLVVAAYVFATSVSIPRPGPEGLVSDHELIALAVAQAATGVCSDRQFLGVIDRLRRRNTRQRSAGIHTDSRSPAHSSRANARASSRSVFARARVIPVSSGLTTTTRSTCGSRIRATSQQLPVTPTPPDPTATGS